MLASVLNHQRYLVSSLSCWVGVPTRREHATGLRNLVYHWFLNSGVEPFLFLVLPSDCRWHCFSPECFAL